MNRNLKRRREAAVDPLSNAEVRRTASTGTTEVDFVPLAESLLAVTDGAPLDLACLLRDVAVCAREFNANVDALEQPLTYLCHYEAPKTPKDDFWLGHLQGEAYVLAWAIVVWLTRHLERPPYGGGCRAFYTPEEWVNRGEEYGGNAMLVICHDGGDMSAASGVLADPEAVASLTDLLAQCGYRLARFGWYSGVYPL